MTHILSFWIWLEIKACFFKTDQPTGSDSENENEKAAEMVLAEVEELNSLEG